MRRFWWKVGLFFAPFVALLGVPIAILTRAGELTPIDEVIARQRSFDPPLFGPAYTNPVKAYKALAVKDRDPELIALGSSRVMQLRGDFFRRPEHAYNAGGGMATIWHLRGFLSQIREGAQLKQIVLGLDQWLFNRNDPEQRDSSSGGFAPDSPLNTIQRRWIAVYQDLWGGKIPLRRLFAPRRDPAIGMNAIVYRNGFRSDGSYYYGKTIAAPDAADRWDQGFRETLDRVAHGVRHFEWGGEVWQDALDELDRFLVECERRKIHVVGFLPPYSPALLAAMRASGHYGYLEELPSQVAALFARHGLTLIDTTDPAQLGAGDSEFIDGFHGSDRTYLRLLRLLAARDPVLAAEVDDEALARRLSGSSARFEVAPR